MVDGQELKMFKTVNSSTWNLKTSTFKIGTQELQDKGAPLLNREIDINPHFPYLYLPDADWNAFADALEKVHVNDQD